MDVQKIISDGMHAKALLNDEVLQKVLDEIRSEYVQRLISSPVTASEERERLYLCIQTVNAVTKVLEAKFNGYIVEQNKLNNENNY